MAGKSILTISQQEEICERYQAGESGPQLAKLFGISYTPIYNSLMAFSIDRRLKPYYLRLGRTKITEICARYKAGETERELAKVFQISPTVIHRILCDLKVPRRRIAPRLKLNPSKAQKVCDYYQGGQDIAELAKVFNVSGRCIWEVLKRNNIKRRPPGPGSQPGSENPNWKGGRFRSTGGYMQVYKPNHPHANVCGYVPEHRLIMEKMIGRYLKASEVVHHENRITDDNRPENLRLFNSSAEHLKYHRTKAMTK